MPEKFAKQIVACNIVTAVMLFVVGGGVGAALLVGYARGGAQAPAKTDSPAGAGSSAKVASEGTKGEPSNAPVAAKPFCPMPTLRDVPTAVKGYALYQDADDCFSLEYPAGWKLDEDTAALHLWASGKGVAEGEAYWTADVVVQRPDKNEDARQLYAELSQKGWQPDGDITLVSGWEPVAAGDGSALQDRTREWAVFTGRGVFHLVALYKAGGNVTEKELEKVIATFQAQ